MNSEHDGSGIQSLREFVFLRHEVVFSCAVLSYRGDLHISSFWTNRSATVPTQKAGAARTLAGCGGKAGSICFVFGMKCERVMKEDQGKTIAKATVNSSHQFFGQCGKVGDLSFNLVD